MHNIVECKVVSDASLANMNEQNLLRPLRSSALDLAYCAIAPLTPIAVPPGWCVDVLALSYSLHTAILLPFSTSWLNQLPKLLFAPTVQLTPTSAKG